VAAVSGVGEDGDGVGVRDGGGDGGEVVGVEAAVGHAGGAVARGVEGATHARLAVEEAEGQVEGGGDGAGRLGGEEGDGAPVGESVGVVVVGGRGNPAVAGAAVVASAGGGCGCGCVCVGCALNRKPNQNINMRRVPHAVGLLALALPLKAAMVGAGLGTAPRGVISFELDNCLWDKNMLQRAVRGELQEHLRSVLQQQSTLEPLDAYEELESLKAQGAELGMMCSGIHAVQKEALRIVIATAGLDEEESVAATEKALKQWQKSQDVHAEMLLENEAVPMLKELRERGFACCAITNSIGDSARTPSLAPLIDFTLNTYDFTVGAAEAWDVALQVAPAKMGAMGVPWVHVGGDAEGGLVRAAAAGMKTVAVSGREESPEGSAASMRIGSLSELPDAVEKLLA
jgi:phosphoglycolate phosphatase-like HAD superfamily hydrolase